MLTVVHWSHFSELLVRYQFENYLLRSDRYVFPLFLCYTQPPRRSLDGYKHVVDVEYCPPVSSDGAHFPPEAAKAKEAAQSSPSPQNTLEYHEIVEGEDTKIKPHLI